MANYWWRTIMVGVKVNDIAYNHAIHLTAYVAGAPSASGDGGRSASNTGNN